MSRSKITLHLNNFQTKAIYFQIIEPHMRELEKRGIKNIYFDGTSLKKNGIKGKLLFAALEFKIFIDRIFKRVLTNFDFYFYNVVAQGAFFSADTILKNIPDKPDVIILYWVSGMVNMRTIYNLQQKTGAKVYWYFMDKSPVTGGCHYTWECKNFETNECRGCQAVKFAPLAFLPANNYRFKKRYLDKMDITALSPTTETFDLIKQSPLFNNKKVLMQPIGIDGNVFKTSRVQRLSFYNLTKQPDEIYLLFGANGIEQKRKGLSILIDALKCIEVSDASIFRRICVLTAGQSNNNALSNAGIKNLHLGSVTIDNLIELYNFTDIYVCPSIEDTGPLMVNQASMCGTPIVAFNTGVAPDLIDTAQSGYLAKLGDECDFAKGILTLIKINHYRDFDRRLFNKNRASEKIGINVSTRKLISNMSLTSVAG